ncbi:MAG: hypothetical protein HFG26_06255 [Provencibacterium sp.]|jgi:hypothetical protein|nr:hypothetical protein [Provencibacterium sp.]
MEEFIMATVEKGADGTLQIRPDGSASPFQKNCLIPAGMTLAAGDRVLLLKYAGCRLVLGRYAL